MCICICIKCICIKYMSINLTFKYFKFYYLSHEQMPSDVLRPLRLPDNGFKESMDSLMRYPRDESYAIALTQWFY